MGLLSGILTAPIAPVRGVAWIAERIREQAEREYYDLGAIQRGMARADELLAAGEITEQERDELQDAYLSRLFQAQRRRQAGQR
ncbi:MAG: gas vesicle protein GvpG [Saccharopolyspora sp.]|uniref:gas vesicle protein GvpG n=1 Tax=Saccharopolyspora TaxID=1835 RepID=UPI00190C9162|nr:MULTISPECIES: gas vesicle protein GvpG [unclassified Saccharopolyspora]MBK0867802.1 gas vesicle protein GvpG [Saccharopolyspora sp. HNM0986]MBQ6641710.1 gas vesicle protein GvpG [Saccharopolyspora sp.]